MLNSHVMKRGTSSNEPFLSVVLPVYNEQARLPLALADILDYLAQSKGPWEIVIADDGSTDRTPELIREWSGREPRIRAVALGRNQGKGEAVRRGMLEAKGRYRLFRDADASTKMREFDRFLPALERGAGVVIGSRRVAGSQTTAHQPWLRETLGRGFTWLCRLLFVWRVHDFTCGFKAFSAEAAEAVFSRQRTRRWAFDAEILFLADRLGFAIEQIPVVWADSPGTKVRLFLDVSRSFAEILSIRTSHLLGLYRL